MGKVAKDGKEHGGGGACESVGGGVVGAGGGGGSRRENIRDLKDALAELGELQFLSKYVRRAAKRIGEARVEECRAAAD